MKLLCKPYHTRQRFATDMQSSRTGKILRVTQPPKKLESCFICKKIDVIQHEGPGPPLSDPEGQKD